MFDPSKTYGYFIDNIQIALINLFPVNGSTFANSTPITPNSSTSVNQSTSV
jgi:hypothetical protein